MSWRVSLKQPIYTIFGANTGVGKTIFSTLLVKAFAPNITYIKPVSTGPLSDADYLHVDRYCDGVEGKVLFQFDEPCSPHIAAGQNPPSDSIILQKLSNLLQESKERPVLLETAGGVHSPAPSGSSQLDLYRPFRLPVILVADSNLGGISTTISAYESLKLHGYDVAAVVGFKASWGNMPYLASKLPVPTIQMPAPPPKQKDDEEDVENMGVYYDLVSKSSAMQALKAELLDLHARRVERLQEMPDQALAKLWYPFTQHSHLDRDRITTIDSALGDDFSTFEQKTTELRPVFDGSASWWTQGLGHGNAELALEGAYAASRYGHVILPSTVNEPALALAERLLMTVGKGWASRVYYSDNGATGIEVALKMALKASRVRYGQDKESLKLGIIGLTGSYHGDTIGAMDASDPNVYNDEVDWYQGRGLFFDPPSVMMKRGTWCLSIPDQSGKATTSSFQTLRDLFNVEERKSSDVAAIYKTWITDRIATAVQNGQKFGALLFEPLLLGAGGMVFVDPLFQHMLTQIIRQAEDLCPPSAVSDDWRGLPVITDEVFTGLYRLSHQRTFDLLDMKPDISVNAKLLTGGAVPLATTMSRESIFTTFLQESKKDALLHGHSYTAHPIGTSIALKSLSLLDEMHDSSSNDLSTAMARQTIPDAKADWQNSPIHSIWQQDWIVELSHHSKIEGVVCLGSVVAMTLLDEAGGYSSLIASTLVQRLRTNGVDQTSLDAGIGRGIMVRPLGNVVYIMASQMTSRETASDIQRIVLDCLDSQ